MTLTFPPKIITKSKTCNGDEWLAEEKSNKRKMSKLSEKAFSPPWDLGCFLWNCDCSIWQKEPIWNFGFFSQFQFQVLVGTGNVLCKVWVTRATTAEFRLLQKCHKYFPSCWFGSKLIEHNLFLAISPQKKKLLLPLTERLYPILTFSRSQRI